MSQNNPFIRGAKDAERRVREMSIHEFTSIPITERPLLVDVRTEDEWDDGHAEGAVHLCAGAIEERIREIVTDSTTPIVCYCVDGERSALVAEELSELGYTHVASLSGGLKAWLSAKEPIVHPASR